MFVCALYLRSHGKYQGRSYTEIMCFMLSRSRPSAPTLKDESSIVRDDPHGVGCCFVCMWNRGPNILARRANYGGRPPVTKMSPAAG